VYIVHSPHLGVSGSEVGDLIQRHQAQKKDSDGFCHDLGIGLYGPETSNVRSDVRKTKDRLAPLEIQYEARSLGSGLLVLFDMVNQNYGLRSILLLTYFTMHRGVQTEWHNDLQFQYMADGHSMCWPRSYHEHDLRCLRSPVPRHTNRVESHALNRALVLRYFRHRIVDVEVEDLDLVHMDYKGVLSCLHSGQQMNYPLYHVGSYLKLIEGLTKTKHVQSEGAGQCIGMGL
jgi:hypothetical protein